MIYELLSQSRKINKRGWGTGGTLNREPRVIFPVFTSSRSLPNRDEQKREKFHDLMIFYCIYKKAVAQRCSPKKVFLEISKRFTGKHLCHSLILHKVALWKKSLWHRCFPVNFAKFLRISFLTEHFR